MFSALREYHEYIQGCSVHWRDIPTSEDLQSGNTMSIYTEQNRDNDEVHTTEAVVIQSLSAA